MRYYRSSFAIFSIIEKLAQFLIKTKLQNNKSNNEILLERATVLILIFL